MVAFYKTWMVDPSQLDVLREHYEHIGIARVFWAFWFDEWRTTLIKIVPEAIDGTRPVKEVVKELRELWLELQERYK